MKTIYFLLFLACCVLMTPGILLAEDSSPLKTALLIFGEEPEDYDAREQTIQALRNVLRQANYLEKNITILKNGNAEAKTQANRVNILAELDKLNDQPWGELFIYASMRTVSPGGSGTASYLVCPSNGKTLNYLNFDDPKKLEYRADHLINLQEEFIDPIGQLPIDRRFLILNTLTPQPQKRGEMTIKERGPNNDDIKPAKSASQAFGQIVVNDSLRLEPLEPGTVNCFVDILEKGMLGFADTTQNGNFNGKVEMNELLDYIEHFGNMAAKNSVKTLFKGQEDFNLVSYQPARAILDAQKLEQKQFVERWKNVAMPPLPPGKAESAPKTPPGKWYCLLFAVNEDEKEIMPLLDGPYNDMQLLKEKWLLPVQKQMADERGCKLEDVMEIHLLACRKNESEEKKLSSQENFFKKLQEIRKKAKDGDFILVAAACHGVSWNGRSFLCPYDLQEKPPLTSPQNLDTYAKTKNLIAIRDVIHELKQAKGHKLLIADACREGDRKGNHDFLTEFKSLMDSFYKNNTQEDPFKLAVMTSCSLGEVAYETKDGKNGQFFKSFTDGLKIDNQEMEADRLGNGNGFVTLNEAYTYAFKETSNVTSTYSTPQTPELFRGTGWSNFALQKSTFGSRSGFLEETDDEFLIRQAVAHRQAEKFKESQEILTHLIKTAPNHTTAYQSRSKVHLAESEKRKETPMELYQAALEDCKRIGQTLDLLSIVPQSGNTVLLYLEPKRGLRPVKSIYQGQKVSISNIQGEWLYVLRSSDDARQNGVGWIHKNNVTWSEQSVEQYRPATPMMPRPPMEQQSWRRGTPIVDPGGGPMSPVSIPGI